jgi:hypothetical protein
MDTSVDSRYALEQISCARHSLRQLDDATGLKARSTSRPGAPAPCLAPVWDDPPRVRENTGAASDLGDASHLLD